MKFSVPRASFSVPGEDITAKHIVHEVIKLEVKTEPADDYGEFPPRRNKKPKKTAARRQEESLEIKQEPRSPSNHRPVVSIKREAEEEDSPQKKRRQRHDSDESPPRKQRHDSNKSPPRRQRHDSDESPPRKQRHDSDESPPRRRQRHDSDESPPRQRQRHDSDESPPRRRQRHDTDNSPPRKRTVAVSAADDEDQSPPRKNRRSSAPDSDLSPPRVKVGGGGGSDSDMSPPRQTNGVGGGKKAGETLDGKRAGLQQAADLKDELRAIRQGRLTYFLEILYRYGKSTVCTGNTVPVQYRTGTRNGYVPYLTSTYLYGFFVTIFLRNPSVI
jgi:hypothetical protein